MQEVTIQQFMKELLKLSGLSQSQLAKKIHLTQGSLSNSLKKGNPNIKIIQKISSLLLQEKQKCLILLVGNQHLDFEFFDYRNFHFISCNGMSVKETAEKIEINDGTLRSRLSRNSCTMQQLQKHIEALGEKATFIINNTKYILK